MSAKHSLICTHCQQTVTPTGLAGELLARVQRGEMRLAMVECPACGRHIGVKAPDIRQNAPAADAPIWRCPTVACAGWVNDIAACAAHASHALRARSAAPEGAGLARERPFAAARVASDPLGCGECGHTWADEAALIADIRAITARFAHRKAAYRVSKTRVLPVPFEQQPYGYDAQVEGER